MTALTVTGDDVRAVLDTVPDPEMPPISVAELGMVVDVRVDDRRAEVVLVPTYSGCPAIAMIRQDVTRAVASLDGIDEVVVHFTSAVVWEPSRITEAGREKLRAFGIQHPHGAGGTGGGPVLVGIGGVACPLCGSRNTVADSPFGPTPCRSSSYCNDCRNPFELIKD